MNKKLITFALLLIWAQIGQGGIVILKRSWVEEYKDRATIDASFTVDAAHKSPNGPKDDADMHIAGRAPREIGLPIVAEMVNAYYAATGPEQDAIALIHANEGTGEFVPISGAWRLWFEHPAVSQKQFAQLGKLKGTGPLHSFEIHPITKFNGQDVSSTFRMIKGFTGYDAKTAFGLYEKSEISIRATASSIALNSKKRVYNYTHFRMHLLAKPLELKDGGYVGLANVTEEEEGEDDDPFAERVRMIFVPHTPPWDTIDKGVKNGSIGDGSELDALGIPRVNLNAISAAVGTAVNITIPPRKLPYEIIIVGLK